MPIQEVVDVRKAVRAPSKRLAVARAARVSAMTVSRVVNGDPCVAPRTRRRVLAACSRLGYRKNLSAAILRGRPSQAIGVIVSCLRHTYYARFVAGVEAAATRAGHHVVILQDETDGDDAKRLGWDGCEFLLARQIDGLIVHTTMRPSVVKRLRSTGIPAVFVDEPQTRHGFAFVGTADVSGAAAMTRHLIDKGHRRIAFLGGPGGSYTSRKRHEGFLAALGEARIPCDPRLYAPTNYDLDGGYSAVDGLFRRAGRRGLTAIFGANDYVAVGAMRALWERGIRVPAEVSVVGFTGDEIGAYVCPPLTTMMQPGNQIGRRAVRLLLSQIGQPVAAAEQILLEPTLVERGSVADIRPRRTPASKETP